jgi:hypothetical protein
MHPPIERNHRAGSFHQKYHPTRPAVIKPSSHVDRCSHMVHVVKNNQKAPIHSDRKSVLRW